MKKKDLIAKIAERGYTKKDAETILHDVCDTIIECVAHGEKVLISGFGSFDSIYREPTTVLCAATKERMPVPGTNVPTFKSGKVFKDSVRAGKLTESIARTNREASDE